MLYEKEYLQNSKSSYRQQFPSKLKSRREDEIAGSDQEADLDPNLVSHLGSADIGLKIVIFKSQPL
jgi:hypothetical protein